jgi:hypothetical protein
MNRTLIIICFVLAVVLIGEVIFFTFFFSPSSSVNTQNIGIPQANNQKEYFIESSNSRIAIDNKLINPQQGINQDSLSNWYTMLRWYKNSTLVSSIWENILEGTVTKIDADGGKVAEQDFDRSITITGTNNEKDIFYLTEEILSLPTTHVVRLRNGTETPININEIGINDKIRVILKIDMKKDFLSGQLEYKFIKLN